MNLIVAPNGVALSEEIQQQSQNPPLLWTLAGVAGELMRASVPDLAVACLVLEQWHRERGTAELAALHAMVAP
jgi:hypothetical protein